MERPRSCSWHLLVLLGACQAAGLAVNGGVEYQTIEGFGAFYEAADISKWNHVFSELGISMIRVSLPYNASGIVHFMNRVGLNIAKEMFFTAEPVKAERAYHFGILNHLVSSREIEKFTLDLAATIAANSPLAVAVIKEQFRLLSEAHPLTPDAFERIQALRRKVYNSRDYEEGINAFFEKRKPVFKGE